MTDHSRRKFLYASAATAATALTFPPLSNAAPASSENELCVFTKPLQHLSYEALAELTAEMGFDGIEGTVRKGGHVEPERVEEDLPKQIEALKKSGVAMTIMTTDVNTADSPLHRRVIKTAADLGVKSFRMGAIKYTSDVPLADQLEKIKNTFSELVAFCQPLGIRPLYQNHAGAGRLGSGLWDLNEVLKTLPTESSGVAFDIRHATVEGGQSWPTEFQLMRPHFGMVYCKDFIWETGNKRPVNVPLGTGRVDYPAFIKLLKKPKYEGPISLHMEYKDHKDPTLLKESIAAIKADKKALDELLAGKKA
jgi:sugar phosphate isomerase/epimerase